MTALSGWELGIKYSLIWGHKWQVLLILEPILTPLHPKQEHYFIDTPNVECNTLPDRKTSLNTLKKPPGAQLGFNIL